MSGPHPEPSRKEAIWLACKEKSCCYNAVVIPTGRDIWRIARSLDAPPWSFLIYFPSREPRRDAFSLDRSGRTFRLALAKGTTRRKKTPPPCIFLMRTRAGFHRCGLGDLRPAVCHVFPAETVDGILCVRPDAGCTCRPWSLADMDFGEEWERIETRQAEGEEYCRVVGRWNERVGAAAEGSSFTFLDFCTYLLETYDELQEVAP
jgi:hypothetical protein